MVLFLDDLDCKSRYYLLYEEKLTKKGEGDIMRISFMQKIFVLLLGFTTLLLADINTQLLQAAKQGNMKKVKELISKGANVNYKNSSGDSPISNAAFYGHIKIVKYLMSKGGVVYDESHSHKVPPNWATLD